MTSPAKVMSSPAKVARPEPEDHHQLELLGYPRFRDVPMALDIPPDDISSEDEKYKLEGIVDIDDLPPPPDDFLQEYVSPPASKTTIIYQMLYSRGLVGHFKQQE